MRISWLRFVAVSVVAVACLAATAHAASPGDVIITEIMKNPAAVFDSEGEWFELVNRSAAPIDIEGWTIHDLDLDAHTIATGAPFIVPAGGYVVLGINGDADVNGGVHVDYVYSGFLIGNMADEIIVEDQLGTEIDRVGFDDGIQWPDPKGATLEVSAAWLDNDDPTNWCIPDTHFGAGDRGSPGGPPTAVLYAVRSGDDVALSWKCGGAPVALERGSRFDLTDLTPIGSVSGGRSTLDVGVVHLPLALTYQVW